MDFIVKYWAQLTVLIGVIGYALKGLFDFRLKKLEIKYSLLFKERLSAVSNFFHLVNILKDETGGLIEGILDGEQIRHCPQNFRVLEINQIRFCGQRPQNLRICFIKVFTKV